MKKIILIHSQIKKHIQKVSCTTISNIYSLHFVIISYSGVFLTTSKIIKIKLIRLHTLKNNYKNSIDRKVVLLRVAQSSQFSQMIVDIPKNIFGLFGPRLKQP